MRKFTAIFLLVAIFSLSFHNSRADWWDDFIGTIHEKLTAGADFIKEKAGPAIREKFDDAKETLQDPETHEKVQTWVKEKAMPVIREKFLQFKEFVNEEVAPEVQKIVEAANEASKKKQKEKEKPASVIHEKLQQFKDFIDEEIAPKLQKIVEITREISENIEVKERDKEKIQEND